MSQDFEAKKRKVAQAQRELQKAVAGERKRLLAERAAIDKQIADLDAMSGAQPAGKRRSGIRQDVLSQVKKHPAGVSAANIRTTLNVTDKSGAQSVSNALAALKKAGQIDLKDGKYKAK